MNTAAPYYQSASGGSATKLTRASPKPPAINNNSENAGMQPKL